MKVRHFGAPSGSTAGVTLQQALLERRNSLNVVRLLLAASVVLWHAWPIAQLGPAPGWVRPLGVLAVPGFFCLSGFLIAASRMRLGLGAFVWNRCLRILPAFWVVLLVVAFVAAPLSTLRGGEWRAHEAASYVVRNAGLRLTQRNIPGTVDDWSWNGSLWSLFYEFAAYVAAGLLLTLGAARRNAALVTVSLLPLVAAAAWWANGPGEVTTSLLLQSVRLAGYFLAGMVLYFAAGRLPMDWRIAVLAWTAVAAAYAGGVMDIAGPLPFAYGLLWLGGVIPPRWAQRHDISYGVYIYAFPVQTMLEWFVPDLGLVPHVGAALGLTIPLAWASWLLVERPLLRLKRGVGGQGSRRTRWSGRPRVPSRS